MEEIHAINRLADTYARILIGIESPIPIKSYSASLGEGISFEIAAITITSAAMSILIIGAAVLLMSSITETLGALITLFISTLIFCIIGWET